MTRAKAHILSLVRRGPRTVLWTKPIFRIGNLFYLWLQAMKRIENGDDCRVLITDAAQPWACEFPRLFEELCISRRDVRLTDRRELGTFQGLGADYSVEDIEAFTRRYILSSPGLRRFEASAVGHGLGQPETVTVNVRRGDYYSVLEYRQRYGFDVQGYVQAAIRIHRATHPVRRVFFVSDDVDWCHAVLTPPLARQGIEVSSVSGANPMRDFAHLALSTRLVLANSTFSYWGGYVAGVRDAEADIVAPWFHARDWLDGKSFHLHPRWQLVEGFHQGEQWR